MAKVNEPALFDPITSEAAKAAYLPYQQSQLELFKKTINDLHTMHCEPFDSNEFVSLLLKHLNVFYYQPSATEINKTLTLYTNFGNMQNVVLHLMKCDATLFYKLPEETKGKSLILFKILEVSPYMKLLLTTLASQLEMIGTYANLVRPSPLVIFDKKATAVLTSKVCTPRDENNPVMVTGLGSATFTSIPLKYAMINITFDLPSEKIIYSMSKTQFKVLFDQDDKKINKGSILHSLLSWIETNKTNNAKTEYFVLPSQFSFTRTEGENTPMAVQFKKILELNNASELKDFKSYLALNSKDMIKVSLRFLLSINMLFTPDCEIKANDFTKFQEKLDSGASSIVSPQQKQHEISLIHNEFVTFFQSLISEQKIDLKHIKKTNLKIKEDFVSSSYVPINKPSTSHAASSDFVIRSVNTNDMNNPLFNDEDASDDGADLEDETS